MTDDQIKDQIRQATDSSIQALTLMVREIQNDNRKHREEELGSREDHRKKMLKEVKEIVEITVNGKIDLANRKLDTLISRSAPVIKQYEDSRGFWETMKGYAGRIGLVGALIAGTIVIFNYLNKISQ